jgi:hypothetical protein
MMLFIRTLIGFTITITDVDRSTPVKDVILSISEKLNRNPDDLILYRSTRNLDPSKTLGEYNIESEMVLEVTPKITRK